MQEALVLSLFAAAVLAAAVSGHSVIWALIFGFFLFTGYGLKKGFTLAELRPMIMKGVKPIVGIAIVLALIGMMTGSWRASGTIARLVSDAATLVTPQWCLLSGFLLNGLLSTLTGTAFGTAATMGVISMTLADAMGVSPFLMGGAILSGAFLGDRCSPVSTSASLVCILTHTQIYRNMALMVRTAVVPFALACALFGGLGLLTPDTGVRVDIGAVFARSLVMDLTVLAPAVVLLALIFLKVAIRYVMAASTLTAVLICYFVQQQSAAEIARTLICGFSSADPGLQKMLGGGGLVSMLPVCAIVLISSTFAGLFEGTGLIDALKRAVPKLARTVTPFGAVVITAIVTGAIACNQVLCAMLTHTLCKDIRPDQQTLAIDLEDTSIVIAPLIPWSIAGAVPIATVGAPAVCTAAAFYLWLLPLWGIWRCRKDRLPERPAGDGTAA